MFLRGLIARDEERALRSVGCQNGVLVRGGIIFREGCVCGPLMLFPFAGAPRPGEALHYHVL